MRNYIVPILCLLSLTAGAQLSTPSRDQADPAVARTIEVMGTAETWTAPTSVEFQVRIVTRNSNKSEALAENDRKLAKLKTLAKDFAITGGDFKLTNTRNFDDYHNHESAPFAVERSVSLSLVKPDKTDSLVQAIVRSDAGDVSATRLVLADPIAVRNQARKQALLAAREKAQEMALTLGENAGRAYRIVEVQGNSWNSPAANMVSTTTSSESEERNGLVSTKASVRVTFLLKD